MKNNTNNTWKIVLTVLLVVLIAAASFCGFALFRFSQTVESLARDFKMPQENSEMVISDETALSGFYQTLFDQMDRYGDLEKSEEAASRLVSQVFIKTMKDCTVRSIDFEKDKIIVNVHGVAVPASKLDAGLVASAATKAAFSYLSHDFLSAAVSVLEGSESIKRQLFGSYANELLTSLKDEIMNMEAVPVYYQLTLRIEDGKWIVETVEEQTPPEEDMQKADSVTAEPSLSASFASSDETDK